MFRLVPNRAGLPWLGVARDVRPRYAALCAALDDLFGGDEAADDVAPACLQAMRNALLPFALSSRLWRQRVLPLPSAVWRPHAAEGASLFGPVRAMSAWLADAACPDSVEALHRFHAGLMHAAGRVAPSWLRDRPLRLTWSTWLSTPPTVIAPNLRLLEFVLHDAAWRRRVGTSILLPLALVLIHPYDDGNGRCARALSVALAAAALGAAQVAPTLCVFMQAGATVYRHALPALVAGDDALFLRLMQTCARSFRSLQSAQGVCAQRYASALGLDAPLTAAEQRLVGAICLTDAAWNAPPADVSPGVRRAMERAFRRHAAPDGTEVWINETALAEADRLAWALFRVL